MIPHEKHRTRSKQTIMGNGFRLQRVEFDHRVYLTNSQLYPISQSPQG